MRPALLAFPAALALAASACAQGVGIPPIVEPSREAAPSTLSDPTVAQPTPGSIIDPVPWDPSAADPAAQSPASSLPAASAGPPIDVDRVMDGVKKCWTAIPRVYGTEAQGGIARLRIKFTPDGRLDGPPMIIDKPLGPVGTKFAESAAKAVESCQPYALPPERYAEWRQIEMKFDTIDPDNPPPPPAPPAAAATPDTGAAPAVSTPDGYVPSVPAPGETGGSPEPSALPQ